MTTDNTMYYVSSHIHLYEPERYNREEFIAITTTRWYNDIDLYFRPTKGWEVRQWGPFNTLKEARACMWNEIGICHLIKPERVGYVSDTCSIVEMYGTGRLPKLTREETYNWLKKRGAFQKLRYDASDEAYAEQAGQLMLDLMEEGLYSEYIEYLLFHYNESWLALANHS